MVLMALALTFISIHSLVSRNKESLLLKVRVEPPAGLAVWNTETLLPYKGPRSQLDLKL